MYEWIGFIGMIFINSCYAPQLYQTIKTKKARDINLRFYSLLLIGLFFYMVYAILISNIVYMTANTLSIIQGGLMLYFSRRYKIHDGNSNRLQTIQETGYVSPKQGEI